MPSDSVIHSLAGAAGGIIAMTATYPLIFLSTRAAVEVKSEPQGSATTMISNPIWVVQTTQAVRTMEQTVPPAEGASGDASSSTTQPPRVVVKKLGIIATIQHILRKDGLAAFWRGLGPALVLVINPVIQYTVFEQLKNLLVRRRLTKIREMGPAVQVASAILSDWDYFLLGALSKLSCVPVPLTKRVLFSRNTDIGCDMTVFSPLGHPTLAPSEMLLHPRVVKSRLQAGHAHALRYKSALDGLLTIVKEEGIEGLYKGVGSKLTQSVLTAAILFASQKRIFEMTKQALALRPPV
ncbi:hypothetical protein EIP91_003623 [Steccherinum ochraceum]|uniref:ADP/ATP carrier protein n=1 Tax=Steccherinum ochraceum TaxID=92696 RepID=A0A4R0RCP4_9APHY|nr:hypothetical protein EIP91_003623 [Steccherinum ochraceum]